MFPKKLETQPEALDVPRRCDLERGMPALPFVHVLGDLNRLHALSVNEHAQGDTGLVAAGVHIDLRMPSALAGILEPHATDVCLSRFHRPRNLQAGDPGRKRVVTVGPVLHGVRGRDPLLAQELYHHRMELVAPAGNVDALWADARHIE